MRSTHEDESTIQYIRPRAHSTSLAGRYRVFTGKHFVWLLLLGLTLFLFLKFMPKLLSYTPESYGHLWVNRVWLWLHIVSSTLAIAAGPFQFSIRLQTRARSWHRRIGKTYVYAVLIAAPTAMYLSYFIEFLGAWFNFLFFLMSCAWAYTTLVAVRQIRGGNVEAHRQWMVRSYFCTCLFVTVRLFPLFYNVLHLSSVGNLLDLYFIYSWVLFVGGFVTMEWIFRTRKVANLAA